MYSSTQTVCLWGLGMFGLYSAFLVPGAVFAPVSWAVISICIWLAYAVLRPDHNRKAFIWGLIGAVALLGFLAQDASFKSWGDVYFFCGSKMQYCTCGFRWNLAGWYKAIVLWNFVLSTALGIQRLVILLGLCGLLPGEEVVTRESFISICWRLIPYFLNAWEQQWGAECSSMMFELPHFAVELLIILPCVQILCSRMKVLAMPSVNAALPPGRDGRPEVVREEYVPNVLRGCWERQPKQRHVWHRIRANKRIIAFSCLLCLMAGFNALYIPLHLEDLILQHPDAALMQVAGRLPEWHDAKGLAKIHKGLTHGSLQLRRSFVVEQAAAAAVTAAKQAHRGASTAAGPTGAFWRQGAPGSNSSAGGVLAATLDSSNSSSNGTLAAPGAAAAAAAVVSLSAAEVGPWQHNASWLGEAVAGLVERVSLYKGEPRQCPDMERLKRNLLKHHEEIFRMQDPEHRATIPLVEIALALMRLSTEKFFVLMSLYVAFLVFRVPPRYAAYLITLNARISGAFARLILYSFPAVCWVYGAGFIFSTFVSVVFWGGPLMQLYEFMRSSICSVSIKALRPATAAEIERMHGDCAICWCEMTVAPGRNSSGGSGSSSSGAGPGTMAASIGALRDGAAAAVEDLAGMDGQAAGAGSISAAVAGSTAQQQLSSHQREQGLQLTAEHADATAHCAALAAQADQPPGVAAEEKEAAAAAEAPNSAFHAVLEAVEADQADQPAAPEAGAHAPAAVGAAGDGAVAAGAVAAAGGAGAGVVPLADAAAVSAATSSHGATLPCGHAYHHQCLNQWLQQCHSQGVTPTCPMCQVPLQLNIQWHLLWRWARPAAAAAEGPHGARGAGGAAAAGVGEAGEAANNYLLEHQPRLADLLADMPQILAQENVQLLAEVQDLRHQRQQLVGELQLRQQQVQELAGRQQQLELEGMEMEQQRRQLVQELQLLRRARDRQRQLQQLIEHHQQHQQQQRNRPEGAAMPLDSQQGALDSSRHDDDGGAAAHAVPVDAAAHDWNELAAGGLLVAGEGVGEGMNLQRFRQLELLLDAFIREQELAASRGMEAPAPAPPPAASSSAGSRWLAARRAAAVAAQQQEQQQSRSAMPTVVSVAAAGHGMKQQLRPQQHGSDGNSSQPAGSSAGQGSNSSTADVQPAAMSLAEQQQAELHDAGDPGDSHPGRAQLRLRWLARQTGQQQR